MPDNSENIAELEESQRAAISSTNIDGVSATVDLKRQNQALRDQKLRDGASLAAGNARPTTHRLKLGGAW